MAKKTLPTDGVLQELRAFGLAFPGAALKSPWPDHLDLVVNDKTFAWLPADGQPFSIGCKLPVSNEKALMLPGVVPSGYGLGKSGWVTATFADGEIPVDLLKDWIDESYRAQAPKRLVKLHDAERAITTKPARTTTPAKKTPRKVAGKRDRGRAE